MKYVFCYDISDNKTLQKVSKLLSKKGIRVQYSIFEVELPSKDANNLFDEICNLINKDTDRIFMYPINKYKKEIDYMGTNTYPKVF
ncbi:CRISPR-associated endonuclease Cas2 [Persephonella sp.]